MLWGHIKSNSARMLTKIDAILDNVSYITGSQCYRTCAIKKFHNDEDIASLQDLPT